MMDDETIARLRKRACGDGLVTIRRGLLRELLDAAERAPRLRPRPRGTKWCPDCGCARPTTEFFRDARRATGLGVYCKTHSEERRQASINKRRRAEAQAAR